MLRNESRVCPTNLTQWLRVNLVWLAEDKYTCLELYRLAISDKRTRSKECQLKYLLGYKQNIPPCRFFFFKEKSSLTSWITKKKKKKQEKRCLPSPSLFSVSISSYHSCVHAWMIRNHNSTWPPGEWMWNFSCSSPKSLQNKQTKTILTC